MKRKLFIIFSTLVLIITLLFSFVFKDNKENNKEISKVEKILSKPEGIEAYTLNGEKANKEFNDLINNYVLDKIICKNGTIATYNKATNEVSLSNIHMPDYCTMNFRYTIYGRLLADNQTIKTRTDFSTVFSEENTGILYKSTEKSVHNTVDTTVYYFAGNAKNNWVKFAGYYWKIVRTNEDGSIRLLYHGTSHDSTESYIGKSSFNSPANNPMYVGYMYGTSGTLASNRTNENDSIIKGVIDTWYSNNLSSYTKYLSKEAVYCNDREIGSGTYNLGSDMFTFASRSRLENKTPTYNCTNIKDAFSGSNSEAKLTYPIGLMTADELNFAGGVFWGNNANVWYFRNSKEGKLETSPEIGVDTESSYSSTGSVQWHTMSPGDYGYNGSAFMFRVNGSGGIGDYSNRDLSNSFAVRPVISLKGNLVWKSGNGSSASPYEVEDLPLTLSEKLLADNPTVKTRTDFSTTYTETNIGTLFKSTESIAGSSPETVYYFSGDAKNNWVKFGRWEEDKILYYGVYDISSGESIKYSNTLDECKASLYSSDYTCNKFIIAKKGDPMYWRIVRTNHDSSIRLIYHGTTPYGNNSFIGTSAFSNYSGDPLYAGYMYGTSGSLENNRLNTNSSVIKLFLENWYSNNLNSYSRYISKNAVYCGNRTLAGGNTYSLNSSFHYLSSGKQHNNVAYYDCESLQDSFSAKGAGIGNSQLEKPIGLITYDELVFAGARYGETMDKGYIFLNAKNETSVYDRPWLTMSPQFYGTNHTAIFYLNSRKQFLGLLGGYDVRENESNLTVRPVISIKTDALWFKGNGSPENPYEIVYN